VCYVYLVLCLIFVISESKAVMICYPHFNPIIDTVMSASDEFMHSARLYTGIHKNFRIQKYQDHCRVACDAVYFYRKAGTNSDDRYENHRRNRFKRTYPSCMITDYRWDPILGLV
jgi:hypothetical protein